MQPYRESVSSGDDYFAITRVVAPGPANTPRETYTLTFTLQRAPTRLLRISFAKNREMLQQEAIQNPMTVELLYDDSDCLYPLWQVTREPAHLPQGAGPQPTQVHLITTLYFNEENWDLDKIQPSHEIVMHVEYIERGNIALALRWIQQKLSNDLRLEFEERWRAFLSSDQVCILLAGNVEALAPIKHAYKRKFYNGTSEERRGDVGVRRRFQARWGEFLQTLMGKKMAGNQDTLAQVRKQMKRAMHEPAPPRQDVWYQVHSRGGDAWEDGVVYPETPRERAERQARERALQDTRDWFRRLGEQQDAGGGF